MFTCVRVSFAFSLDESVAGAVLRWFPSAQVVASTGHTALVGPEAATIVQRVLDFTLSAAEAAATTGTRGAGDAAS
jgi:hypothetical protein